MRVRVIVLTCLLLALCGCGDPWATKRVATDALYWTSTVAYGLIQAQAVTGTIPDTMTPEQFAAAVAKADAAYAEVQVAYAQCAIAIEAQDTATYSAVFARLAMNAAATLQVKAAVCPVINKKQVTCNFTSGTGG